jgi:hypothetical protein
MVEMRCRRPALVLDIVASEVRSVPTSALPRKAVVIVCLALHL